MPPRKRVLTPPSPPTIRAAHPAIAMLFHTIAARRDLSIKGVARKSGICAESLRGWRRGKSARIADVEAALNAAGKKIVVVSLEDNVDSFQ